MLASGSVREGAEAGGGTPDMYRCAALALSTMQRLGIAPTPAAYGLWLSYHARVSPELNQRVDELVRASARFDEATIGGLRAEFDLGSLESAPADDPLMDASSSLQDAAQMLMSQAASSRMAVQAFGASLERSVTALDGRPGAEDSMRVISQLSHETLRMAEFNRHLREQLAAASDNMERLRAQLSEKRLAGQADRLTGLATRRAFQARLQRALAGLQAQAGEAEPVSVLMFDIDHFRRINDAYGLGTGDLVLRLVARLLVESIKGRDLAARHGGEEFAVLLVGADLEAAARVARQIGSVLSTKQIKLVNAVERGYGSVSVSAGVTQLRMQDTAESVIERANAALLVAKRSGRNRVVTDRDI